MSGTATGIEAGLVAQSLRKEYPTPGEPLVVLREATLALAPGQSAAILGPSGSGKSTLLNILGTLDRPTAGSVRLDGIDPFALDDAGLARFRSERIGFIFQEHHLLPQCTALENVLVARLASGRVTAEDADRARDLLGRVGLVHRLTHLPGELSGGERQRVAIARAMMNSPRVLLCDEPTGNLDVKTSRTVGELLAQIAGDGSAMLVVVTHSPALAGMFGRTLRIDDGVLREDESR